MDSNKFKLRKAKNKVEKLKRFYTHLAVYMAINSVITIVKVMSGMNNGETFKDALFDYSTLMSWMVWGMVLLIHAFAVFGLPRIIGDDWEEQKIQQFMDEELQQDKNYK